MSLKGEIPVLDAIPSAPRTRPRVINPQTGLIETMERELGLGAVTFLAFSLNEKLLEGWRGRTRIPLEQLQANRKRILFTPEEVMGSNTRGRGFFSGLMVGEEPESPEMAKSLPKLRQALDESFAQDTPVQPASSGKVAGFLLFFLLITVPGNYLLFGWFRRREWAWLAIPFWAIFFSFLAYFMGYYGQLGKLTVNEVGVIEAGPGQSYATGRTFLCLYAPRRDEYDLSFEPEHQAGPGHLIFPELKTRGLDNFGPLHLRDRQKSLDIEDLLVQARSTRRLELIHRVALKDGIELAIRRDKAKGVFSGRAWNRTGQDLLKAVWVHQASGGLKTFPLDLPAKMGDPKEFQAPLDLSEGWGSLKESFFSAPPRFPSAPGAEAKERSAKLLTYLESRIPKFGQNLLLCWLDGSQLPIKVNGEPPLHSSGFSLMIMPFNIEEGQGLIKMEEGWRIFHSAEADLINESHPFGEDVPWTEKKGREPFFPAGRNPSQAVLLLRIMAPISPHRLNQPVLRLNLNIHALTLKEAKEKISAQIQNAPGAFSAKAVWEILEQGVAKASWRRMESLDLALKAGQTCPPWSLSFPVERSMLWPESSFVLRLRLEGARFEGRWTLDGEENRWPVAVYLGGPDPGLILEGKVPETEQGK
jgi:hypothetical protein